MLRQNAWKKQSAYRNVVSGDTSPTQSVIDACNGCDVLIHEVHAGRGVNPSKRSITVDQWMKYESEFHASATELGNIARRANAKMLVLTHWTLLGNAKEDDIVAQIRKEYNGPVIVGRDLNVIAP